MASKTIGIFHYQVGGTDGVSLEIEKWKQVLEGLGHKVHLVAGNLGTSQGYLVEEMYHHLPKIERLYLNTFTKLSHFDAASYQAELNLTAEKIKERFRQVIRQAGINHILAENIWCVGINPAAAPALELVRQEFGLPALAHHHDFYWERHGGHSLTCAAATELADKYLPPRDPKIVHTVINSLSRDELLLRKSIHSQVIPNVFDFNSKEWVKDEYNSDLRARIGIQENDLVILQATRIVTRKGIELAIDFTKTLGTPRHRKTLEERGLFDGRTFNADNRIVLVLAGYSHDDLEGHYYRKLEEKAAQAGVDIIFIDKLVNSRRTTRNGQKIYSLWDTYTIADLVTYPSLWEGWGNQLLEAIKARLPVVLFEYPVYVQDIKEKGFRVISLGSEVTGRDQNNLVQVEQAVLDDAAEQGVILLTDDQVRQQVINHNFRIAQNHYSLAALQSILAPLFDSNSSK